MYKPGNILYQYLTIQNYVLYLRAFSPPSCKTYIPMFEAQIIRNVIQRVTCGHSKSNSSSNSACKYCKSAITTATRTTRVSNIAQVHTLIIPNRCFDRCNLGFVYEARYCNQFSRSPGQRELSGFATIADYLGTQGTARTWFTRTFTSFSDSSMALAPRLVDRLASVICFPSFFSFLCGNSILSLRVALSFASATNQPLLQNQPWLQNHPWLQNQPWLQCVFIVFALWDVLASPMLLPGRDLHVGEKFVVPCWTRQECNFQTFSLGTWIYAVKPGKNVR